MAQHEMDRTDRAAPVRSIDRALSILEQLAIADGPCSLSQLSCAAGLSAGTTHRVIRTLVRRGYVRQVAATRAYVLGPSLVGLGEQAKYGMAIGIEPRLRDLAERAGGTAGLAVLDGPDVVFVAQAAPRKRGLRMVIELGERVPFAPAIADAILAALPPESLLGRAGGGALRRRGDPDLTARLEQVRRRGYAVDDGERNGGISCLAVGLDRSAVPAAVTLVGVGRSSDAGFSAAVELLRSAASAFRADIGGRS